MRKLDAASFLATCACVLFFNAVVAIGVGCSFYGIQALIERATSFRPAAPVTQTN